MDELVKKIEEITECCVPSNVVSNMQDEGLTLTSFCLLTDDDLKSLGFKLGPRKLILSWMKEQQTDVEAFPDSTSAEFSVRGLVPNHGTKILADPATPRMTAVNTSTRTANAATDVITPIVNDQEILSVKLWNKDRSQKYRVVASSLEELKTKGCAKMGIEAVNCRIVEEVDGTDVGDWEAVGLLNRHSEGVVLILLVSNEEWCGAANEIDKTMLPAKSSQTVHDDQPTAVKASLISTSAACSVSALVSKYGTEIIANHAVTPRKTPVRPVDISTSSAHTSAPDTTPIIKNQEISVKVWNKDRSKKHRVVASSLEELKTKGCEKMGIDGVNCRMVEEVDGTEVDDWEVVQNLHSAGVVLILLMSNEEWSRAGNKSIKTQSLLNVEREELIHQGKLPCVPVSNIKPIQMQTQSGIITSLITKQINSLEFDNDSNVSQTAALIADARLTSSQWTALWNNDSFCGFINHCIDKCIATEHLRNLITNNENMKEKIPAPLLIQLETLLAYAGVKDLSKPTRSSLSSQLSSMEKSDLTSNAKCPMSNDLGKPRAQINEMMEVDNIKTPMKNCDIRRVLLGERRLSISQREYFQISQIMPTPQVRSQCGNVKQFVGEVLPYLLQRVKMRGCRVLQAHRIAELVSLDAQTQQAGGSNKPSHNISTPYNSSMRHCCSVSRIDCVTCIFNVVDSVVASDLLASMAQFPIALPLAIQNLNNKSHSVLTPLLGGTTVKWESGRIIENSLFRDTFKLLVAVRIGANEFGKSTILNQLFSTENMFSSCGEPGSEFGRPVCLDGTIELVCLTQETCKDTFWKHAINDFYKHGRNEVSLLANIHGDITSYPQHIDFMNIFSCHYLVFIMPSCSHQSFTDFVDKVGSRDKITSIRVDPLDYTDITDIKTSQLVSDRMMQKVRNIVKDALSRCQVVHNFDPNVIYTVPQSRLEIVRPIQSAQSQKIVDYVSKQTCKNTKRCLYLQVRPSQGSNNGKTTKQFKNPDEITVMFTQTFQLPSNEIGVALLHLEKELSRLSNAESSRARSNVSQLKASLQKEIAGSAKQNDQKVESLKREITSALEEVDSMNLGLEHFFRELAQLYANAMAAAGKKDNISELPHKVAELFLRGHPIELLDGDAGDIASVWFSAMCSNIDKLFPGMRVFVVSILGLQSSGKSTLLNSLFACRFAVSVGRCSRGLYMRLLLLDKTLKSTYHADAILLIDTEGLGSPEKMNDPDADKKDRLLATFAMGISNLTIINVLGENMKDLTEILQIAVVTLARLEKADISPDIIMVQHLLTEKNSEKTSMSEEQFCDAIRKAIDLAEKKDMQVGVRNAKCLKGLFDRIKDGTLLVQFHPYKDGATVSSPPSESYHNDVIELYTKILGSCQRSETTFQFKKWHSLVESYWEFISQEDFALRFKNVKEIYEFIDRGHRIGQVKESISEAFRFHSAQLQTYVASKAREHSSNAPKDSQIAHEIRRKLDSVPTSCQECSVCAKVAQAKNELFEYVRDQPFERETISTINTFESLVREDTCKQLEQMFKAATVQQGCCIEFDNVIEKCLRDHLKVKRGGQFSESEKLYIVTRTIETLKQLAYNMDDNKDSVLDKFTKELQSVYEHQPNVIRFFKQPIAFQDIFLKPEVAKKPVLLRVYKGVKDMFRFSDQHHKDFSHLENCLSKSVEQLIGQSNCRCFEIGIVDKMSRGVDVELDQFRKKNRRLETDEKVNAHLWTQQLLYKRLRELQDNWDKKNKPLMILNQHETRYTGIINTRLDLGFSRLSESVILGQEILDAVTRKASAHISERRIQHVKGLVWITNAEKVRLKYLLHLADQVLSGNKTSAIQHFKTPRTAIERWFRDEVDGYGDTVTLQKELDKYYKAEVDMLKTIIRQAGSVKQMLSEAKQYIKSVNVLNYTTLNVLEEGTPDDLEMIKDAIIQCLDRTLPNVSEIELSPPSNDPDVMARLGCTESCFWCGSLCWGHRNHSQNDDDTRKHHSSHQSQGLHGTHCKNTRVLLAQPCQNLKDDTNVHFGKYMEDGIPWITAKSEHFSDWKFDSHYITRFDEIMRWFFQELHADIASSHGAELHPAGKSDLQEHKCVGLELKKISIRINQEIS